MERPIHLLHLEDNPLDAELIKEKLEADDLPCAIVWAHNREQFETALAESSFDLILCDYNLPDYDGIAALKLVQQTYPYTPVIMVSGLLGEEEAVQCLLLGATDYLLKQRLERLPSAIRRALAAEEERKLRQIEAELRDSEERFRQLAEQSSEAFWFVGRNPERVLYVSPAVEKIWGLPAEHFYQETRIWLTTIHPEDQPRVQKAWEAFLNDQTPRYDEEYRILRPDDSIRWVLVSGISIRDESGDIVRLSGVARDITERKQNEANLLRAQRLESIGTLAASVAHDLNNTLAPILMGMELLRAQYPEPSALLDILETSIQRGSEMARQLLAFAKSVQGKRQTLQPQKILEEVERILKSTLPKNIHLQVTSQPNLHAIRANAAQLQQVLLHLCANARDAMPEGGTLTLTVENVEIDTTYAGLVLDAKPGLYVMWRVLDTGTGIAPEVIDHIFEPFFTTKEPDQGIGIGLPTVFGIVSSHGGFVQVYSKPGQGSTFAVYLPASASLALPEVDAPDAAPFRGNGETILVVDDEASVRNILSSVLRMLNFEVVTADDGAAALLEVKQRQGQLRAVITDLYMPRMDGLNFVHALKNILPDVGVIVISGRLEENHIKEFTELGINALLDKPFTQEKLVRALKTVF